jgi:hypothetical protein
MNLLVIIKDEPDSPHLLSPKCTGYPVFCSLCPKSHLYAAACAQHPTKPNQNYRKMQEKPLIPPKQTEIIEKCRKMPLIICGLN